MHDETLPLDMDAALPATPEPARTWPAQRFEFRGAAGEYFRIWIVNLALGIVTLGIYSAWASVRTRRWFYANTLLAGSSFEYAAQPLPILRGRLLAALLFALYVVAGRTSPRLQLAAAALIALALPWLVVRGLAFRARYSAWRGLPFRFEPDYRGAYVWYFAVYLLMLPTLGLVYPWIKRRQQQWLASHHRYGSAPFAFEADTGDYYVVFFVAIGIALLSFIILGMVVAGGVAAAAHAGAGAGDPRRHPFALVLAVYALYLPAYLAVYSYFHSRILNLLYNGVRLAGGHRLRSTLGFWALLWIYASNLVAIIATLGMATAWAKVRLARYRAAHLALLPGGDLDAFVAETGAQTDIGALGVEMDGFFNIDIGL